MSKLKNIQKKIYELKLYREYLLKLKLFNSLNNVYDNKEKKRNIKVKRLCK